MRSHEVKLGARAKCGRIFGVLVALMIGSPGQAWGQQAEFDRFRNALVDYFRQLNYVPVLINRGYAVGDVVEVDGVNFYARAARCFPKLLPSEPISATLPSVVETDSAGLNFGLRLKQLFDSSAGVDLVRRITIKFTDVTVVSAAMIELRHALDRQVCPEIAPLVDGTISEVDRNRIPFFVVSEVVYGKREATLQLRAGGDLPAEVERLRSQIGDASLTIGGFTGGVITLKSEVVTPIAIRPVTIPKVIPVNQPEGHQVKWEPVDCSATEHCAASFDAFASLVKTYRPMLSVFDLER
jgi:hypothetical protein